MRARWIATAMAAGAMISGITIPAHAQAATSYGMAASHSATVTTGVAKKLSNALNQTNQQIASKLSSIPQSSMAENRRKLEIKAGTAPATLHIDSTPDKATISVDGVAVANTPADLKLPSGQHQIEINRAGFSSWKQEVTLQAGGNPVLKPALENKYKSELKLTIHQ